MTLRCKISLGDFIRCMCCRLIVLLPHVIMCSRTIHSDRCTESSTRTCLDIDVVRTEELQFSTWKEQRCIAESNCLAMSSTMLTNVLFDQLLQHTTQCSCHGAQLFPATINVECWQRADVALVRYIFTLGDIHAQK
jgi:hypothetical protein